MSGFIANCENSFKKRRFALWPRPDVVLVLNRLIELLSASLSDERSVLEPAQVRVLVVDDFGPWQDFVSKTVGKEPDLEIIGRVADGSEAVEQAEQLQPDLILLDIGLPTLNGIEAATRIREVSPTSKILFVSEDRSVDIAEKALSTGAGGYVVKSDAASDLLTAIKAVLEGKRFVSASLAGHFLVTATSTITQTSLSWMVVLISGIG